MNTLRGGATPPLATPRWRRRLTMSTAAAVLLTVLSPLAPSANATAPPAEPGTIVNATCTGFHSTWEGSELVTDPPLAPKEKGTFQRCFYVYELPSDPSFPYQYYMARETVEFHDTGWGVSMDDNNGTAVITSSVASLSNLFDASPTVTSSKCYTSQIAFSYSFLGAGLSYKPVLCNGHSQTLVSKDARSGKWSVSNVEDVPFWDVSYVQKVPRGSHPTYTFTTTVPEFTNTYVTGISSLTSHWTYKKFWLYWTDKMATQYAVAADRVDPVVVTTSSVPAQPSVGCDTCNAADIQAGDGGVLSATSTDPGGRALNYTFRVYLNEQPFPLAVQGNVTGVPSGQPARFAIPAGMLTPGHDYSFVVDVDNGLVGGTSSTFDVFSYQSEQAPTQPTIDCVTCNAASVQAGGGGALGATATDPNGDDVRYQFRLIGNVPGFPQIASGWVTGVSGETVNWPLPVGLKPGPYAYVVDVLDARGAQGQSSNFGYFTQQDEVAPTQPTGVSCVSCTNNAVQYGGDPVLTATSTDGNGDSIAYQFRVIDNVTGFPQVASGWVTGTSGQPVQWKVPPGVLVPGHTYAYLADVADAQLQGTSSGFSYFAYSAGVQTRGAATTDSSTGSRNYLSIAQPTGTAAGDVLVANVTVSNDSTVTAPTGWTVLPGWPKNDGSETWRTKQYIFTHRVTSSDQGPYRFATNGPGGYVAATGVVVAVSGVSTSTAITTRSATVPGGVSVGVTSQAVPAGGLDLGLTSATNGSTTPTTTSPSAPMAGQVDATEAYRDSGLDVGNGITAGTSPFVVFTFSQNSQGVAALLTFAPA